MRPNERRAAIFDALCIRRQDTVENLASEYCIPDSCQYGSGGKRRVCTHCLLHSFCIMGTSGDKPVGVLSHCLRAETEAKMLFRKTPTSERDNYVYRQLLRIWM